MKQWIGILIIAFSFNALAAVDNLQALNRRFDFIKNDKGELIFVKIKMVNSKFSIRPYLEQVKLDLKELIFSMRNKGVFEVQMDEFSEWMIENSDEKSDIYEKISVVKNSLKELESVNVDEVFQTIDSAGVFTELESEISKMFINLSPSIIANTTDASFFYRRNVTYEVVKRVLDFARKRLSSIPLLNVAAVFIEKVHSLILDQREFHQNMLLHYLQNVPETKLGLTKSEVDRIMSSIYESRISALNYIESNKAQALWSRYGADNFFTILRAANTKIRRSENQYESVGPRYNYAFVEVVENGKRVVKNLIDSQHSYTTTSATAYYYDNPKKVRTMRILLNLAQLGLGFVPAPNWLKAQVNGFISSLYESQIKTEGALVGYFEFQGDTQMAQKIYGQVQNPYLTR